MIEPFFFEKGSREYDIWLKSMEEAEKAYNELIGLGATPEEARTVLPNSLKTEIVVTYNLREWRHFFHLRCSRGAHPQIREIAIMLLEKLQECVPVVFEDFVIDKDKNIATTKFLLPS